jgi:glycosyltransferase involved in cell wall biosynthesis
MGAAPELVAHGETGLLCPELADMVEAVNRLGEISPAACRTRVAANFTDEVMVESYETIFKQVLAGR